MYSDRTHAVIRAIEAGEDVQIKCVGMTINLVLNGVVLWWTRGSTIAETAALLDRVKSVVRRCYPYREPVVINV